MSKVLVEDFPFTANDEGLKKTFSNFGKVTDASVKIDSDGKYPFSVAP